MKYQSLAVAAALLGSATANPHLRHSHARRGVITKRQIPQEHSHAVFLGITREFLNLDNPKGIVDPVFGFLGAAAAAEGAGQVTNLDCLKQETADQAFTNAKAAGDIRGMSAALVFQALERNAPSVGAASALCTEAPVNPEIGAFSQHQDAAGEGHQAINKGIALALAEQLALIGGDPLLALESGSFVPGELNDPTAKGNSCNDDTDPVGCIFTERLLFLDATPEEIASAVEGITPTFTGTGELQATHIDFAGLPVAEVAANEIVVPTPVAGGNANAGNGNNNNGGNAGNGTAVVDAPPAATSSAAPVSGAAVDLGSCTDPTVKFAAGLDGRTEEAFQPNNLDEFGHGSAQNIGIITSFICQRIASSCRAPTATQDLCTQAASAAAAASGQAAADAFNSILTGGSAAAAPADDAACPAKRRARKVRSTSVFTSV